MQAKRGSERAWHWPFTCAASYARSGPWSPCWVAHFFTKLKTAEEVLEYTGAFCELYRQEGWYLERTVHYVNRVGLDYVKKRILQDPEGRKALWEQLQFALDGEPDPWFDFDKAAVDQRQFIPISVA